MAPGVAEAVDTLPQRLVDRRNILISGGEAVLKGQGIEQHQTPNPQGSGAISLLVSAGNYVGDAPGYARVSGDMLGSLLHGVPHGYGSGGHPVHALKLQRKSAQLVGKLRRRPAPYAPLRRTCTEGAVQPPS